MRKIIILLLCCGVLVGMVGCGDNTAPPPTESAPTTVSETIITETPTKTIPPVTAVEPTEKEKEHPPTREHGSGDSDNCDRHRAYSNDKADGRIQANGKSKTDRTISGGNSKGKRMHHNSGNRRSA